MRVLFTTYPLHGHVNPMLPLARRPATPATRSSSRPART